MKRHVRELHKAFPDAIISTTGGGHLRLRLNNGRAVFAASTPSCHRNLRNTKRDVRRKLLEGKPSTSSNN